jgi:hypothetical protein
MVLFVMTKGWAMVSPTYEVASHNCSTPKLSSGMFSAFDYLNDLFKYSLRDRTAVPKHTGELTGSSTVNIVLCRSRILFHYLHDWRQRVYTVQHREDFCEAGARAFSTSGFRKQLAHPENQR